MMILRAVQVSVEALSLRVKFRNFTSVPRLSFFSGLVSCMEDSIRLSSASDSESSLSCCGPASFSKVLAILF